MSSNQACRGGYILDVRLYKKHETELRGLSSI